MLKRLGTLSAALLLVLLGVRHSAAATGTGAGVGLTWDRSKGTNIAGYYIYYGPSSGQYTQRVDVGSNTSATVNGLSAGSTNYFVATAYDGQRVESDPSNEAAFIQPGTLGDEVDLLNHLHLIFPVANGRSYEVQFSSTLTNWTTLATVLSTTNGMFDFVDTNFTGAAKRFYRLVLH